MAQTQQGRYIEALVEALAEGSLCTDYWGEYVNPRSKRLSQRSRERCHQCPVILACAIYSERVPEKEGTWAGMTYMKNGRVYV